MRMVATMARPVDGEPSRTGAGLFAGLLAVLLLAAGPAAAHKLKLFATPGPDGIAGTAFFARGGPARGVDVTLRGPGGAVLAVTRSADDGSFAFPAPPPAAHAIVAETVDGHRAVFEVAPPPAAAPATPAVPAAPEAAACSPERLEAAVARQIGPLRHDLSDQADTLRWRDLLGGLGWIAGLFGIGAWVMARRRPLPPRHGSL